MQAESIRPCHKQAEFVDRIERAMGITMGPVSCHIVNEQGMESALTRAGWSKNEAAGVVGFQVAKDVYVLDSTPWTVLHELVHRSGVNGDRLNRFVAEGLTEAVAREIKQGDDEHRPTYPTETAWVQKELLPMLGMTAVQLGTELAKASSPPDRLASLIASVRPGTNVNALRHSLRPQSPEKPRLNRRGHVTRLRPAGSRARPPMESGSSVSKVGLVLMAAGAALVLSSL